jgi:predicted adenylyl cyclase CyaB
MAVCKGGLFYAMSYRNIEIKARCADPSFIRQYLLQHNALLKGVDEQTDTYFHVQQGRLKLREGNIEKALIFYRRKNIAGPNLSEVVLYQLKDDAVALKLALVNSLGIKTVVKKRREIYFIKNVKFHIDVVEGLGSFVEIEAIDADGKIGMEIIKQQCEFYVAALGI